MTTMTLRRCTLLAASAALLTLAGCGSGGSPVASTGTMTESASASGTETAGQTSTETSTGTGTETTGSTSTATGTGGSGVPGTFKAFGTEPFWDVAVDGDTLVYNRVGEAERRLTASNSSDATATRYTGDADGSAFTLTVTKGECSDGMSDETYQFTAEFTIGGETLKGCAKP